jgi:hypothetical protein
MNISYVDALTNSSIIMFFIISCVYRKYQIHKVNLLFL